MNELWPNADDGLQFQREGEQRKEYIYNKIHIIKSRTHQNLRKIRPHI